jgi:hypothetical protein
MARHMLAVIPGCALLRADPESRSLRNVTGFRVRAEPVIGPRFARTRWRAPE